MELDTHIRQCGRLVYRDRQRLTLHRDLTRTTVNQRHKMDRIAHTPQAKQRRRSGFGAWVVQRSVFMPDAVNAMGHPAVAIKQAEIRATSADALPLAVPTAGRNEPSPCGSGVKYKHCHSRSRLSAPPRTSSAAAQISARAAGTRRSGAESRSVAVRTTGHPRSIPRTKPSPCARTMIKFQHL
jgi:hypothetical protein